VSGDELRLNPYVGLRPFFAEDRLYFYGRDQQTAELLGILRQQRFLAVVGSSGSGKSSLVRAGLLPSLLGGFLVQDRDRWRTVQIKPGAAPIGNLADGLLKAMELARTPEALARLEQDIRENHTDAVVDFLTAHLGDRANLFLLVDQFEEIFAFRGAADEMADDTDLTRRKERTRRRAEAADFVDLLLELAERRELPIYVALTMRSDFLGECDLFLGLPEALNRGRYLVPRLTREQLRDAVECPALLKGAEVAPRLLDHVLNELGTGSDRLPVLQHVLLRTWDAWQHAGGDGPVDLEHYRKAEGLEGALDKDAEGALGGLDREVTARVFKRLTDTDASHRRVRSPARISELMAGAGADRATVEAIVSRFKGDGRSFVHPSPDGKPDDPRVDISHESLIRQWESLATWVDEERVSRDTFRDLVKRSRKHALGEAGLLQAPELQSVFDWRAQTRPSSGWAQRYAVADDDFDRAMGYLDKSLEMHCAGLAEKELLRRWRLRGRPATLLMALAIAWLVSTPVIAYLTGAGVGETASAAAAMATAKVDNLLWTTDDGRTTLAWKDAEDRCKKLGATWRLPDAHELGALFSSSAEDKDGLGRKLKKDFHKGANVSLLWSRTKPTAATDDPNRYAADFIRGLFLPLSVEVKDAAGALCVSEKAGEAAINQPSLSVAALLKGLGITKEMLLPVVFMVVFLTTYSGLAEGGRWLHRKRFFDTIMRGLSASGGRPPVKAADRPEAVMALNTVYASTWRRGVASAIDLSIVGVLLLLPVGVLVAVMSGGTRITIAQPNGDTVEGTRIGEQDGTVSWKDDKGQVSQFPQLPTAPEYFGLTGGEEVDAMLPSGQLVKGQTFLRQQVIALEPTGEEWYGTVAGAVNSDGTTSLTYSSDHWRQTRDARAVDLLWRFGDNAALVQKELAAWTMKNPSPPEAGQMNRTLHLRVPEVLDTEPPIGLALLALFMVVGWLYEAIQVASRRQATFGMRMVGIIRTDLHGERLSLLRVSARFGYRLFSFMTTWLGFAIQPFTNRRQTLHDRLAGSVVLRRPTPGATPPAESTRSTAVTRGLVVIGYGGFLLLMFLSVLGFYIGDSETGMLPGRNDGARPAPMAWKPVRWEPVGVQFVVKDLKVKERTVREPGSDGTLWRIVVEPKGRARVQLESVVDIKGLPGCVGDRCPVYYTLHVMAAWDNPDADKIPDIVIDGSTCGSPLGHASAPGSHLLNIDKPLPNVAKPGLYELLIDFHKGAGCADPARLPGLFTVPPWSTDLKLASIEVK
jgi:uncharacterized RDD family membrane protein YckC/energy-coupling factor transporter ATP-binding protein EcfA2